MLFDLVKQNNTEKFISYFVKNNNFDINSFDFNHNYLLSYAVLNNNIKIVSFLLKNNARIDIYDNENRSLLFNIIKYNMIEILNLFLIHNKKAVCSDILFHSDIYGLYPIHYSIIFKNINISKMLLTNMYGDNKSPDISNRQIYDLLNNNLLFFSIKNNSFELCEIFVKYVNINDTNSNNNTALHEAIILNNKKIVILLIENNINLNIGNNDHKTCLYYINSNTNKDIITLLLTNNININSQDILGNTIIHDLLLNNDILNPNVNIFENIYEIIKCRNIIFNYNLINIDGNQPLHIILNYKKISAINNKIILNFIKNTDLNIQNNDGITCLNLLFKNNLWKKYMEILYNKKLDIFICDKNNNKLFDDIHPDETSLCFDIITKSYINQLKNNNIEYVNKLDIICSQNKNKPSEENIKFFDEYINTKKYPENFNINDICYDIIKKNIMDQYNNVNTKNLHVTSYPITNRDLNLNIDIEQNKNIGINTFIGIKVDILFGVLYILKKHNDNCYSPIHIDKKIFFDISWSNYKLEIYDDMKKKILNFISHSKKKFMIIPIEISVDNKFHNNYLLYDRDLNEFERFEPDGSHAPYGLNYDVDKFDLALEKYFDNINIKYISPMHFLPKIGLQRLEIQEKYTFFDNNKFCALWCIWYADMRITYHSLNRNNFINLLISTIKHKKMSFKYVIRTYSEQITLLRDTLLNNINININDFINGFVTSNEYNNLHKLIKNEIKNYDLE